MASNVMLYLCRLSILFLLVCHLRTAYSEQNTVPPKPTNPIPKLGDSTTAKPTTAKQITAKPTTAKPTTAKPTTAKPTTAKPTTAKPTTAKPTTAKPTTAKPSNHTSTPTMSTAKPSNHTTTPTMSTVKPSNHTTTPTTTARPRKHTTSSTGNFTTASTTAFAPTARHIKDCHICEKKLASERHYKWAAVSFDVIFAIGLVIMTVLYCRQRKMYREMEGDGSLSRLI